MKKVILAVCLAFGGATLVNAQQQQTERPQSQTQQSQTQAIDQDQEGEQISVSELPDGVSDQLASQDYTGWTVGNVYKKTGEDQNEMFIVEMRQGTETKKVKFDKDGNKLDKDKAGYKHGDKYKHSEKKTESTQYRDETDTDASSNDDKSSDLDATQSTTEDDQVDKADNTRIQDQK